MADISEEIEELDDDLALDESDSMSVYVDQMRTTADMRSALLSIDKHDPNSLRNVMQNITVMRVYHQLSRIVRYTELMDKIEDKMYESIELTMGDMDSADVGTWYKLVSLQEKLQRSMIESQKLLEPYLDMSQLSVIEIKHDADPAETFTSMIVNKDSREKIRTATQQVIDLLQAADSAETTTQE